VAFSEIRPLIEEDLGGTVEEDIYTNGPFGEDD